MIEVNNLIFEYPGKRALDNVSFTIAKGSITALVGPNGAGKTTLLRCIAALDEPLSGDIVVKGLNVQVAPRAVHRQIGYLSDFFGLYEGLTVAQSLQFIAELHQIAATEIPAKILLAAKRLQLADYLQVKAGTLSRGLRQRLAIAQAIVHEPDYLLLDEPASGLDPGARHHLSKLFLDLHASGVTLIVSSHILAELEDYCTDMLLLKAGKIVDHHEASDLAAEEAQTKSIEVVLSDLAENYKEALANMSDIEVLSTQQKTVVCSFKGDEQALTQLMKALINQGIPVAQFVVKQKKLQDIYMDYADDEVPNEAD